MTTDGSAKTITITPYSTSHSNIMIWGDSNNSSFFAILNRSSVVFMGPESVTPTYDNGVFKVNLPAYSYLFGLSYYDFTLS